MKRRVGFVVRHLLVIGFLAGALAGCVSSPFTDMVAAHEAQIRQLEIQQEELLTRVKRQIAQLENLPPETVNEAPEVAARRARLKQFQARLAVIEQRILQENADRPIFVHLGNAKGEAGEYYRRFFMRIASAPPIKTEWGAEMPRSGQVTVVATVKNDGTLANIVLEDASSELVSQYVERLVRSLAPFEPFGAELQKSSGRLVLIRTILYER